MQKMCDVAQQRAMVSLIISTDHVHCRAVSTENQVFSDALRP